MSTFYIVPSRLLLGQRYSEFLESVFPGRHWPREAWRDLAESLDSEALRQPDTYVIYREDMPDGVAFDEALVRDFGACAGDEAVEVAVGGRLAVLTARRWRIGTGPPQAA